MNFIIIAEGKDGKLYHLYSYSKDFSKESEYKWLSELDLPLTYTSFTDKDSAWYFLNDKRVKLENADNVGKIVVSSIGVGRLEIKIKKIKH